MSVVDPKGAGPKIHGKSKVFELIQRDRKLRQELETKVWPALPAELLQIIQPSLETVENSGMQTLGANSSFPAER